ncbi:hypothetical protein [Streptomyces sp. NPDC056304]|uniref:hypothetical protein n=1 Tax=Streptomyces sp. NPDC056304 TaxID=3345778 RepID=UPI0035E2F07E
MHSRVRERGRVLRDLPDEGDGASVSGRASYRQVDHHRTATDREISHSPGHWLYTRDGTQLSEAFDTALEQAYQA